MARPRLNVAIMAAPRSVPSVHSTLATLAITAGHLVNVCVCVDTTIDQAFARQCIDLYTHLGIEIRSWWPAIGNESPEVRAAYNALECFRWLEEVGGPGVVVEDDVTFSRDWLERLLALEAEHPHAVIFGYERHTPRARLENPDLDHATVFSYWPPLLVPGIRAEFERTLVHDPTPAEWVITRWLRKQGVPMVSVVPSLVQHLGDDALINPHHGVRRSPMWRG